MTEKHDDARLIALGTDISDGRPVDWAHVHRDAKDEDTKTLLSNLERLAAVIAAQRATEAEAPPLGADESTRHWRHLVLLEQVGAGAFGTVYRAWDTQLDREVALKLLSTAATASRAPLTEARHLARIRHPNVVTVYGAEQVGEEVGIWMEFIQGDTLATMVAQRGPMSAREAAGIGIDLCRALSALHGAGLLHRDIKGHNVMRETGGRIVLMDFSGVRAVEPGDGAAELSGTPLYMAPEVLAGGLSSYASDIYSLGVLLFFLLSGRYPVEGPTVADVCAAHARGTRARLLDLRPEIPESVVQVIERALGADPSTRYATVGELEHALASTSGSYALAPVAGSSPRSFTLPMAFRRSPRWVWLSIVVAAVLALATATRVWSHRTVAAPLMIRTTIGPPYNTLSWPRISPDGRLVVFGTLAEGRDVLFLRPLASLEGRPLPDGGARESAFWSPDSRSIAVFDAGKLQVRSASGEGALQILADAPFPRGGAWNRAGTLLFSANKTLHRVSADGSGYQQLTTLDTARGEYEHTWPAYLPDGRRYLFVIRSSRPEVSGLYLGSLDSSKRTRIMPAYSRTVYASSGHLVFVRDGTLMAQSFDAGSETLSGEPIVIATAVKYHSAGDAAFDISDSGVLVYRPSESLPLTRLMLFDRRGRELQALTPVGSFRHPRLSPDGLRVAVERVEPGSTNPDIWIYDLARGSASRFTTAAASDVRPTWSPDGRRIVFSSKRRERFDLYVKTVDATDAEQLLDASAGDKFVEDWSPDGRTLSATVMRSGLWLLPFGKGRKPSLVRRSSGQEHWQSTFSPDGRWIAYVATESRTAEVYVEPVPATGARWQVSAQGGSDPHWRGDARQLVYLDADGWLMSVDVEPAPGWQASPPVRLFRVTVPDPVDASDLTVSRDGHLLVVNTLIGDPNVPPIHVIVNWEGLLRR